MSIGLVSAAYIAATVLFILSLGGLSGQESAKRAVWYGIAGMALAVVATVFGPGVAGLGWILLAVAIGAGAGYYVAGKVEMTEMPQLVAALHSFVGLAAVFIGYNAHIELARVMDMPSSNAPTRSAPTVSTASIEKGFDHCEPMVRPPPFGGTSLIDMRLSKMPCFVYEKREYS